MLTDIEGEIANRVLKSDIYYLGRANIWRYSDRPGLQTFSGGCMIDAILEIYQELARFEAIFGTFMWAVFIATFARKYMR